MTVDRIDVNTPDNWSGPAFALGAIDEIVRTQATVHLEAMSDNAAFLAIAKGGEEVRVWLHARPTTRAERRAMLRHDEDRLVDQVAQLWRRSVIWSVPWWRRPGSVWRSWRAAVRQSRAVLDMREEG